MVFNSALKGLNTDKTETILFFKRSPPPPNPVQIQDTFVPWASAVRFLGPELDSEPLSIRHQHTVTSKATGVFCNFPPPRPRFSARTVQQANPQLITHSIHSSLRRSCLQLHTLFQLSQTPCYPVTMFPSHR